jgi:hypothetical protein
MSQLPAVILNEVKNLDSHVTKAEILRLRLRMTPHVRSAALPQFFPIHADRFLERPVGGRKENGGNARG